MTMTTGAVALPGTVRAVRVLLYIGAVITVLSVLGYLVSEGVSPESLGRMTWYAWPGVLGLVMALQLPQGGRGRYRAVIAVAVFWLIGALARAGEGDPRGVTGLLLPIAVLIVVTRRSSREFFRDPHATP
jgi:hypothetical protein